MRGVTSGAIFVSVILALAGLLLAAGENESAKQNSQTKTYKSKHGFSISYPDDWRLETYMEEYGDLRAAEKDAGNYFDILSYQEDDPRMNSYHYFPADTLKIEAWVFPNYGGTLAEMITQAKGITKIDDFTIGGKKAKKVWQRVEEGVDEGDEIYSIYFVDSGKKAIFTCYPTYTSLKGQFEEIVGSFRFE
jgi:hypothetical protein